MTREIEFDEPKNDASPGPLPRSIVYGNLLYHFWALSMVTLIVHIEIKPFLLLE